MRNQVSRFWGRYGLVLVTNPRQSDLVCMDTPVGKKTVYRIVTSCQELRRLSQVDTQGLREGLAEW